jgi:hypothetical protein
MPTWRPLNAQEPSNGKTKKKATAPAETSFASEPPSRKTPPPLATKAAPSVAAPDAAKGQAGSKYVLDRLRHLEQAAASAPEKRSEKRSEKIFPFERSYIDPTPNGSRSIGENGDRIEGSEEEEELEPMEPLTEIRGAPTSSSGSGRMTWPHKWKTALQQEAQKKQQPKPQPKPEIINPPKRQTVVWNPLDDLPETASQTEEPEPASPLTASPFTFLPQAEQLLSSRTPLEASQVADKALELLQSALKSKPAGLVAGGAVGKGLTEGVKADQGALTRRKSAELLAAARQKMLRASAGRGKGTKNESAIVEVRAERRVCQDERIL